MANVSSSNGLGKCPKLRFPSFDEPWEAEKLSDFSERVVRKNTNNETSLPLTISSKDGLVDQITYFNKTVASKDMSGYYLLKKGEYAYNKSYSVGYDFGSIKRLDRYPMGALSTLYICFALKRHDSDFIRAYFDSLKWYREIYMISAEGARNHGLLNVPTDEFFETIHYIPQDACEQRKIADFLIAIDKRIEAQQSLVENLKKYKRGLLSSLFERCIRFKDNDGSEFPEWEQRKLISCCNGFDKLRQPITANLRRKGKYPYYGANGIQDYVDDYIFDGEYILLAEDGGHFDEFASKPIAQFICGRVWVNNHAHIIQAKQGYNNKYIFYCLEHKDIRKYINGSSRAKLNQEDMWDIPIPVPCLREQERIADFMTAIDCAINDHERRLETLRDLKAGLLQQLFI